MSHIKGKAIYVLVTDGDVQELSPLAETALSNTVYEKKSSYVSEWY